MRAEFNYWGKGRGVRNKEKLQTGRKEKNNVINLGNKQ
jgi:hypothetical protein